MGNEIDLLARARRLGRIAQRAGGVLGASAAVSAVYAGVGAWHRFDEGTAAHWTRIWAEALCRAYGMTVRATGAPPPAGALVVSNHRSYLDIPALGSLIETSFISRVEVKSWPVLGQAAALSSTIFVQRSDPLGRAAVCRRVLDRLERGVSIVNFAEGTTNARTGLLPFRSGLFRAVTGRSIPVVPATVTYRCAERVEYVGDDTFIEHFLRVAGHLGLLADVEFGDPLDAANYTDATTLATETRRRMLVSLARREAIDPAHYPELPSN